MVFTFKSATLSPLGQARSGLSPNLAWSQLVQPHPASLAQLGSAHLMKFLVAVPPDAAAHAGKYADMRRRWFLSDDISTPKASPIVK